MVRPEPPERRRARDQRRVMRPSGDPRVLWREAARMRADAVPTRGPPDLPSLRGPHRRKCDRAGAVVVASSAAATQSAAGPAFVDMPADKTGITWVHENAMSAQRYLPETCGAGCAI